MADPAPTQRQPPLPPTPPIPPLPTTPSEGRRGKPDYRVLLYVPNIIDYVRLFFLLLAFLLLPSSPAWFVVCYSTSIILDGFDGAAARRLKQCSLFGAWFDVVLDNLSRGLLWSHVHPVLSVVSALEWTTFCCNYASSAEWQQSLTYRESKNSPPYLVTLVMAKNFRTPIGVLVMAGLHVLPLWLFGLKYGVFDSHLAFLPHLLQPTGVVVLSAGRLLCGVVEVWCICVHVSSLLVNSSSQP